MKKIILLAALCLFIAIVMNSCSDSSEKQAAPQPAANIHPDSITAVNLIRQYKANEVRADQNYKGKSLLLIGRVCSINKGVGDNIYLLICDVNGYTGSQVQCFISDDAGIAQLDRGHVITLQGVCAGMLLSNVIMKDCKLVQ